MAQPKGAHELCEWELQSVYPTTIVSKLAHRGKFLFVFKYFHRVRKLFLEKLCRYPHFRTTNKLLKTFEPSKTFQNQPETAFDTLFVYLGWGVRAKT